MRILKISIFVLITFLLVVPSSFANLKKGKVGNEGVREFLFTNNSDGPCSAALIYDTVTSDLDVGIFLEEDNSLLAIGFSSQTNFDSAEASLPPGNYGVLVQSFKGASPFRVVVTCANQETLSTAGVSSGLELREVELDAGAKKAAQKMRALAEKLKNR